VSCTAPNRLVSRRAHWSNSLLETVTNQSCIYFRNIRVPVINFTYVPDVAAW